MSLLNHIETVAKNKFRTNSKPDSWANSQVKTVLHRGIEESSKFICDFQEIFDVTVAIVLLQFQKRIESTGSAHVNEQLWFHIKFNLF